MLTDQREQQHCGQGLLKATSSGRWKFRGTTSCKRRQKLSNWPCRAAVPRPFARHARSFYRLHPASTKSVSQGSECLPPARFEFVREARPLRCSATTVPKRWSSVSGCVPPSGNKLRRSALPSVPSATSTATISTVSASGFRSRGTHTVFTSILPPPTTAHAAFR